MSERFDQLAARHQQLRLRSAEQREELGRIVRDIEQRLGRLDRGVSAVRGFVRNPAVIASGFAVLAIFGPKRLLGLASRSAVVLTTLRQALRVTGKLRDQQ